MNNDSVTASNNIASSTDPSNIVTIGLDAVKGTVAGLATAGGSFGLKVIGGAYFGAPVIMIDIMSNYGNEGKVQATITA